LGRAKQLGRAKLLGYARIAINTSQNRS